MRYPHVFIIAIFFLTSACITSSPAEYGATPPAKRLKMKPCKNGMLDDGEDQDSQINKVAGRDGYWFTFADPEGTTIEPKGQFAFAPGGPRGSKYAARIKGRLASSGKSLYAGMGFAFTNPKTPYDLGEAKGIQFWAKGPGRIRFKMPDINTSPEGDRCTDCYNDFGVDLYLSDEWERYTIPFKKLQQQPGWGDRAPYVATGAVFALQWQVSKAGAEYDIAIDNIRLVGCDLPAEDE